MGSSNSRSSLPSALFEQASQHYAQGRFQEALHDALACYRQQPGEEYRRLLERSYAAWAGELHRSGLQMQCRSAVQELLNLGVTDPEVERKLPELVAQANLPEWQADSPDEELSSEEWSRLEQLAADDAILYLRSPSISRPEIREGATTIRQALRAIEAGEESSASALLQDISRRSPFADWKLFVRGLAAYHRQDDRAMRANWDRLDPERAAARIASVLERLAAGNPERDDAQFQAKLRLLEEQIPAATVEDIVLQLQTDIALGRWDAAFSTFQSAYDTLRRLDDELTQRITQVFVRQFIPFAKFKNLRKLTRMADPPPLDPRWNRTWALFWENPEEGDSEKVEQHWRAYLDDLAALPELSQEERTLAQALVWQRLGQHYVALHAGHVMWSFQGEDEPKLHAIERQAIQSYQNSLKLAPTLQSSYQELAEAQLEWQQPAQAAETYQALLEHHPEDVEALNYLSRFYHQQDDPVRAREYVLRAHRLKPLDEVLTQLRWAIHLNMARHHARKGQWPAGRDEFATAEPLSLSGHLRMMLLTRRAIFEQKAGNHSLSDAYFEQAAACLIEPTAMLLEAAIGAIRYELPRATIADYERNWEKALKKRCESQTAARMCQIMLAYLITDVNYPGRERHCQQLLDYLRRTSRVKFEANDLRVVCTYLGVTNEDPKLLELRVRRGIKLFPDEAYFQFATGQLEIDKGPLKANRRLAYRAFQRACELAEQSQRPEDEPLKKESQQQLTFLEQVGMQFPKFSPFTASDRSAEGPGSTSLIDMMAEMIEEAGIDPQQILEDLERSAEEEAPGTASKPTQRRSKPTQRRKKKKR